MYVNIDVNICQGKMKWNPVVILFFVHVFSDLQQVFEDLPGASRW